MKYLFITVFFTKMAGNYTIGSFTTLSVNGGSFTTLSVNGAIVVDCKTRDVFQYTAKMHDLFNLQ
jgi:hypothetical protein